MLVSGPEVMSATIDLDSIAPPQAASPPSAPCSRTVVHAEPRCRPRNLHWADDERPLLAHRLDTAQCVS